MEFPNVKNFLFAKPMKKLSFADVLQNEGLKACNFIKKRPQHWEN